MILNNRILATLAGHEHNNAFLQSLTPVSLNYGEVLIAPSAPIRHTYFLTSGIACWFTTMAEGVAVANYLIGREGLVGIPLLFQGASVPNVTVVMQVAGSAMRIDARRFLDEINKPGNLQSIMRRYTLARLSAMAQTAACNSLHCIQERLACWLLLIADRCGPEFKITHEVLADMLGARRATVSVEAARFSQRGLISYG